MRQVWGLLYDPDRTDKLYIATKMDHGDATKVVTLTVASTSLTRAGDSFAIISIWDESPSPYPSI